MSSSGFEEIIVTVAKTGKYVAGTKEVLKSLRGSRLIVYAGLRSGPHIQRVIDACGKSNVPVARYEGSSEKLGRLLGRPYSVSVLAVRSPGEADLTKVQHANLSE